MQGRRTLAIVPLLVIAGAAEGFGLLTLLPILESVSSPATPSPTARAILGLLARLRLPATLPVLLLSAMAALLLKAALRWLAMAWVARTVADVAAGLRTRLVGALLGARWRHFQTEPAGALA
ncbi:MAG TPA: hypothetical protein VF832_08150, partial [Longimicrobiales bacterium]